MPVDQVLREMKQKMDKSVQYYENELHGIRTGRATTALVDYIKVDYYGSSTELKALAAISVPEPTQILIKPFDPSGKKDIVKALETADLGLNPQVDADSIRITIPAPSRERRQQLAAQVKKLAEDARVAIRNERRDANKHIDQEQKDKDSSVSEDQAKAAKDDVEEMTKKHIASIDAACEKKIKEVETV